MNKQRNRFLIPVLAVMVTVALLTAVVSTAGVNLGGVLKGAGIVLLVDKFGNGLNKTINTLTANKGVSVNEMTKIVPIISLGAGAYAGAAQVSGPASRVKLVKAVAQLETSFSGQTFRIKALVPVASKNVVSNIKRVSGVGVSAVIDVRL